MRTFIILVAVFFIGYLLQDFLVDIPVISTLWYTFSSLFGMVLSLVVFLIELVLSPIRKLFHI